MHGRRCSSRSRWSLEYSATSGAGLRSWLRRRRRDDIDPASAEADGPGAPTRVARADRADRADRAARVHPADRMVADLLEAVAPREVGKVQPSRAFATFRSRSSLSRSRSRRYSFSSVSRSAGSYTLMIFE